jgi:hypothetical protein
MRDERGQATTEYVATILLVAVVLLASVVVVADPGIGRATLDGIRRGLCIVTGEQCRTQLARQPCVVASEGRSQTASVNVSVIRLGADAAVIREVRSDGTVAVTLVGGGSGGVDVGLGVTLGGYGGELRAAGLAGLGGGRTWIARDAREADELIARLGPRDKPLVDQGIALVKGVLGSDDDGPEVRDPDVVFTEGRTVGELGGTLGAVVKGRYGGALTRAVGMRTERSTGRRTMYLSFEGGGSASLGSKLLGSGSAAEGGRLVVGVTLDRDGEPVEASISAARAGTARGRLPSRIEKLLGEQPRSVGARVELEARLDLADPGNAAAIDAFLRAMRRPDRAGDVADASSALGERIAQEAQLEARVYDAASESNELGGRVRVGGGLGAGVETREDSSGLLGAWERPPGGEWLERVDCTEAARA